VGRAGLPGADGADPYFPVAAAWNLDDLGKDYRSFIDAYARREPRTDLPAAYLPPSWPAA
jgi:hypothetical protein